MRGPVLLYVLTGIANALALGYQFVMPRLLRPSEFAILTQLFGILLVGSIGTQVIQQATAKLAAQYRARRDDAALHVFVRRWLRRVSLGGLAPAIVVALASVPLAALAELSVFSVLLLAAALFLAIVLTFTLGILQGLGRFVWLGANLIAQSATRLTLGAALVLAGFGVDGAFLGAMLAVLAGTLLSLVPLRSLFGAARGAVHEAHLGPAESRFFLLAAVVLLAYAGLTNVDAVVARPLLSDADAGAYAGAITMAKIVLFAPIAIGYLLLERTARGHARGEDTERPLLLALAFVLATSGAVSVGYIVAPSFFTALIVGSQYPATPALVPFYGVASLSYALLSLWNAYFIGRGQMWIGLLLALALAAEVALLLAFARDALGMVRIVTAVALATQVCAVGTFAYTRRRSRPVAR